MNTKKIYSKPEIEIWYLQMEPFMSASSVTGAANPIGILQGDPESANVSYFSNRTFGRENE